MKSIIIILMKSIIINLEVLYKVKDLENGRRLFILKDELFYLINVIYNEGHQATEVFFLPYIKFILRYRQ